MSTLSDGLAARDKATPGEWKNSNPWITANSERTLIAVVSDQSTQIQDGGTQRDANLALIAAAPDALDWIAKALPFVKLDLERRRFEDYDDGENKTYCDRDIAALTALIAEAEGTEKEGEK